MKKIKVIEIIPSLKLGGGERVATNISYGLNERKFDVVLISLYKNETKNFIYEKNNVKFIELNKKRGFDFSIILKLIKIFGEEKPDVIHTHLIVAPYTLIPSIFCKVKKKYHTVHSIAKGELSKKKRKIMKILYHLFGYVPVAISPYVRKTISEEYRIEESKIPCIYNGVDTAIFKPEKHNKESKEFKLINVARLSKVKNHKLLIEAFNKALSLNQNIDLTIVGDGEEKKNIVDLIKEKGLESKIHILGAKNNIEYYLNKADAFILTSYYEGMPMSVIEAMSCGLFVISTKAGGVVDILKDGYNGFLVNNDIDDISNKILKVATDNALIQEVSKNNIEDSKEYSITNMVVGYEKLFMD